MNTINPNLTKLFRTNFKMVNRQLRKPFPKAFSRTINRTFFGGCFILLLSFGAILKAQAKTIFVKSNATGTNNGTSWTNAYTDLQVGLSNAVSGDEIWVAKGMYKPTNTTDMRLLQCCPM